MTEKMAKDHRFGIQLQRACCRPNLNQTHNKNLTKAQIVVQLLIDKYMQSRCFSLNSRGRQCGAALTDALCVTGVGHKALVAPAAVAAHGVLTAAIRADAWSG